MSSRTPINWITGIFCLLSMNNKKTDIPNNPQVIWIKNQKGPNNRQDKELFLLLFELI